MLRIAAALVLASLAYASPAFGLNEGLHLVLTNPDGLPEWLDLSLTAAMLAALFWYFWPHEPGGA